MIDAVTAAEDFIAKSAKHAPAKAALPANVAKPADIASTLRGAVAVDKGEGRFDRMICDFRVSDAILDFLSSSKLGELAATRRLDARSFDPHQDRPDGAARARGRQARRLPQGREGARRAIRVGLPRLFRHQ